MGREALSPRQFVPATVHFEWGNTPDDSPAWPEIHHSVCIDCRPKVLAKTAALGTKPSSMEMHRQGVAPTHYCESCHPGGL